MKKLVYFAPIVVALTVGPVSGSVSYQRTGFATQRGDSNATALIPEKVREVLDKVRSSNTDPVKDPAVYVQAGPASQQYTPLAALTPEYYSAPRAREEPLKPQKLGAAAEPGDWTLLPAALLLIGFIIRRRTAVR